ncbi:uncharacterized protein LOC123321868 [Coccinella septempunctata]|uniref:uncharacterized protein LOC123321868 n=1 Tax=Coccinella septempunctata TaxID=41139 RepID=UPI001D07400F|nr:uncharacterized protein LOC123321868 [Coccinella septempunctata]
MTSHFLEWAKNTYVIFNLFLIVNNNFESIYSEFLSVKGRRELGTMANTGMDVERMIRLREEFKQMLSRLDKMELELTEVKKKQKNLTSQTEELVTLMRRRGIIIHHYALGPLTRCRIARNLSGLLDVDISAEDIDDYQRLGTDPTSPLKIIFVSYQTKKLVMENQEKLEGSGMTIEDDTALYEVENDIQLVPESSSDSSDS